jgi:RecB family exonuclease
VACTRARERLLVTAIRSPDDDGEQPSRFLEELGVATVDIQGRPPRPLSLPGLVAELRRTVSDPDASLGLRSAAARRLAMLATSDHRGVGLAPQADPAHWWGIRSRSRSEQPLRPPDEPVTVSATALESLLACPAKWFLEREAGGTTASSASQGFGLVVHTLADRIAKGELTADDDLMAYVDRVWDQLVFRTPWSKAKERAEVEAALDRFVRWHGRADARTVLATEHQLSVDITLPDGELVRINGYADRLEVDAEGAVWVVDLKTGKYPPADKDLATNPQLGLYQHAVNNGAVDDLVARPGRSGGAELVQLRRETRGSVKVQRQPPHEPDADGDLEIETQLQYAVHAIRSETFPARAGGHCDHCSFHAICPIKGAGTVLS